VQVAIRDAPDMLRDLCTHVVIHHDAAPIYWPRHLLDVMALVGQRPDLFARSAARASLHERVALAVTSAVRREVQGETMVTLLASRVVFPRARGSWGMVVPGLGWFGLFGKVGRADLRTLIRAMLPAETFLKAHGYNPDEGLLRARTRHALRVLARANR
jgi:hypothetical protein